MADVRAMILAAGRGERMRPLTDLTPKPLLPVGGKPLIAWHIERLRDAGVVDIVINHAWLGEQIEAALGTGARFGVRLHYSREGQARETAGGLALARQWLGEAPMLLLSGDILTDYPLTRLVAAARALGDDPSRLAHVVLVDNPPYHPRGDWGLTAAGLVDPDRQPAYCYGNLAALRPAIVDGVVPGTSAPLGPLLTAAARAGRVGGEHYGGAWFNVGTPAELAAADAFAGTPAFTAS